MGTRLVWVVGLTLSAGVGMACGGGSSNDNNPTTVLSKPAAQSGNGQTATVNTVLPLQLRAQVTDAGALAAGVTVTWQVVAGGGSVDPTSSVTDANGIAVTTWTLGTTAGVQTARAILAGAGGSPQGYTATGNPGPAAAFTKNAGDGQSAGANGAFATNLQVKVADQFNNAIAGVTVNWAVQSGDVTLGAPTSTTNSVGLASKAITAGATAGPAVVRASTAGLPDLDFNLTVTPAPIEVEAGNIFFTSDKNGTTDPAIDTLNVGQSVRWTASSGTHNIKSVPLGSFTTTDFSTGQSRTLTFNSQGTFNYQCGIHGSDMSGTLVVLP